jgi:hypothetical protein
MFLLDANLELLVRWTWKDTVILGLKAEESHQTRSFVLLRMTQSQLERIPLSDGP